MDSCQLLNTNRSNPFVAGTISQSLSKAIRCFSLLCSMINVSKCSNIVRSSMSSRILMEQTIQINFLLFTFRTLSYCNSARWIQDLDILQYLCTSQTIYTGMIVLSHVTNQSTYFWSNCGVFSKLSSDRI